MPSVTHLVRPDIAALEPYSPAAPLEVLAARLGLPAERIVKLDANENPYGPSPRALEALASYRYYAIYPDPDQTLLRAALSRHTGQPPERIICGSGSDEVIDMLVRAFLQPGDAIVDCPPTFGMYAFDAGIQGARVVKVPRDEAFALDPDEVAEAAERGGAKLLFITSPNNPTGNATPRAAIERLLDLPLLVVVDEAYAEFAGESVADLVGRVPNLAVLRTFSKWAGLGGLRIGYGLMHEELSEHLWKIKQPYNINVAAQVAALASLEDRDHLMENVARIVAERERLYVALSAIPALQVYPSRANFLLCRVLPTNDQRPTTNGGAAGGSPGAGALALREQLMRLGILVRYFDKPGVRDCLRISVGTPDQNDALLLALEGIFHTS